MSQPTVAIVGASSDRSKFGNKSVRAHLQQGYEVYPVNPKGGTIEGLQVYQSLSDVPAQHLNKISVYLPSAIGIKLLDEIVQKQCDELLFNPGSESDELLERAQQLGLNPIVACSIVELGISPSEIAG